MKEIKLTQDKRAIVDDCLYKYLSQWKWFVAKGKNTYYAARTDYEGGIVKRVLMHRVIINAKEGNFVDHINGNGLDNRRCNLRLVTNRQNMQNLHIKKTSRYPGVTWDKNKKKWRAIISINNKDKTLGRFDSERLAYMKYKKSVEDLTGEKIVGTK